MDIVKLVDDFVEKVNAGSRSPLALAEVPEFLRDGENDGTHVGWRIRRSDNSRAMADLTGRLKIGFPPSFHLFLSNFSFPAFEAGPLMFFANTGQKNQWELSDRIFEDKAMSPVLLKAGLLQIGNPFFYNYDPICFNTKHGKHEHPIVHVDHESALQLGEAKVTGEIAPSFIDLMTAFLANK